jgi:hypothetical protein
MLHATSFRVEVAPSGALPAEKEWKRPPPSFRKIDSAMMERAELPVQWNRTL